MPIIDTYVSSLTTTNGKPHCPVLFFSNGRNGNFQLESGVSQIFRMTLPSLLEQGEKNTLYTFLEIRLER